MPWLSTPRSLLSLIRNGRPVLARRQFGADQRQRHLDADARIGRAADDVEHGAAARHRPGRRAGDRRSGAGRPPCISPTTMLLNGGATGRQLLDLECRAIVSVSARASLLERRVAEFAQPGLGNCISSYSF